MQAALQHLLLSILFRHATFLKSEAPPEGECLPRTAVYSGNNLKIACSDENGRITYHFKQPRAANTSSKKQAVRSAPPYDVMFSFRNQAENGAVNISCTITQCGSHFYLTVETGNYFTLSNDQNISIRASTSPNIFGTSCSPDPKIDWSKVVSDKSNRILRESSWKCKVKHWTLNIVIRDEVSEMCDQKIMSERTRHQGGGSLNSNCLHRGRIIEEHPHIDVINKSEPQLHCCKGGTVEITFIATVTPIENYSSSWFKLRPSVSNWEPVSSSSINRRIVGTTVEERLRLTNCSNETEADYKLKIEPHSEDALQWKVIYISEKTKAHIRIHSFPRVDEPFIFWGKKGLAKFFLFQGMIEDLTMEARLDGKGPWLGVNRNELVLYKSANMCSLEWTFTVEKDIEVRCINKTGSEDWRTFANVTSVAKPSTKMTKDGNRTLLTCFVPRKYINQARWSKENQTLRHKSVVENYGEKLTIDTSTVPTPWGQYECRVGPSIYPQYVPPSKAQIQSPNFSLDKNKEIKILPPAKTKKTYIIEIIVVVSSAAALVLFGWLGFIIYQKHRPLSDTERLQRLWKKLTEQPDKENELADKTLPLHERLEQLTYNDRYEIRRENVFFYKKQLGRGQFGSVWKCSVAREQGTDTTLDYIDAAAKMPRDKHNASHYEVLLDELRIMIAVGIHPNVLCLVGATVQHITKEFLCVVVEFCRSGDLKNFAMNNQSKYFDEIHLHEQISKDGYLLPRSHEKRLDESFKAEHDLEADKVNDQNRCENKYFSTTDLISFGYQVANGMEYLSKKMCIHRDLAARNILLTENRIVRIADFGLARKDQKLYQMKSETPMPIRWMSPEAIKQLQFSEKSDIWSFGVLLWELFTFGENPYSELDDNDRVCDHICGGNQLQKPKCCPEIVFELMEECWNFDPKDRPSFTNCRHRMEEIFKKASPVMKARIDAQLEKDRNYMEHYAEYRAECKFLSQTEVVLRL